MLSMYLRVRTGASSGAGRGWGFGVVRALQTKSRGSSPETNSVGLNPGFFAFFPCRIFSSSLAEMVDLIVLATGMSMPSPPRLPLAFMLELDLTEASEDEELLEDEDEDVEEVDESESVSESLG